MAETRSERSSAVSEWLDEKNRRHTRKLKSTKYMRRLHAQRKRCKHHADRIGEDRRRVTDRPRRR